jgi:MerR family mercuric resistance operon transcriptional regulator
MRTGDLAREAGVNIQTIRFYERQHLLAAPPRTAAGYRCYSRAHLERVVFIKICQQLGFTLKDIHSLGELHDCMARAASQQGSDAEYRKIALLAQDRLRQIDEKIRQLTEMREQLQALCDNALPGRKRECPAARLQSNS